ncbi:O-antigen ligase family protein [Candidatus Uhrbacteria bacterium]|nr:O-antigen ligase family protein [Candidatus Uhrbacteria bacterium]
MKTHRPFETAFAVLWRVAILALPWQTRWFADASLAGWPWEQGRWSFYASWLVIMAAVAVGLAILRFDRVHATDGTSISPAKRKFPIGKFRLAGLAAVSLLILATVVACGSDRLAWTAALQWWLQVSVLASFAWILVRVRIPKRTFATWFVVSLIPHVALGIWQYGIQKVIGHPWLGMATQVASDAGVSVVEHGDFRVLRMYGGFPHPNVLGGWAAVGLLLSFWLAATSATKARCLGWSLASAGLAVALLLTFARGAWIAAAVGSAVLLGLLVRAHLAKRPVADGEAPSFQYLGVAASFALLVAAAVVATQFDHLAVRFGRTERLEVKSLEARVSSLRAGTGIFSRHPTFGTGPNAELLDLAGSVDGDVSEAPLEPPHSAYLLAFVNVGIIGSMALVFLAGRFVLSVFRRKERAVPLAMLSTLAVLALFDHYPWSLSAGQSLVASVIAIAFMDRRSDTAPIGGRGMPQ